MFAIFTALISFALIGSVAGMLGGLLGIGGSVITVPSLYLIFRYLYHTGPYDMHLAIGTSLAATVFNTFSSTRAFHQRGSVQWSLLKKMSVGLACGAVIGAVLANALSGVTLQLAFGIFLVILSVNFWMKNPQYQEQPLLPKKNVLFVLSAAIGAISIILGIGGGSLFVPLFNSFKMPPRKATGTSSAGSLFLTTIGAVLYLIVGWKHSKPPENIGYIHMPAFIVVGATSFFTAKYGVQLTHELEPKKIRKIFAIVLFFIGITMIF